MTNEEMWQRIADDYRENHLEDGGWTWEWVNITNGWSRGHCALEYLLRRNGDLERLVDSLMAPSGK